MIRNSAGSDFYRALLDTCREMDIGIEGLHEETGPGVLEAAITFDKALAAADKAALFKTFTKVLAQNHGYMATFMAKWTKDLPGQSGHIHLSLKDADGGSVFHEAGKPHTMSDAMRWFVGGQQKLMPELLAMIAPTVNSYRRLIPGFWAPTDATWGVENRTTALRVIPGSAEIAARRVSHRGGRCQPLRHPRGRARVGTVGHREQDRARADGDRQCVRQEISRAARLAAHALGCRAAAERHRRRRGTCSATISSSISRRRANGKSASSASTSATGNWRATLRSSEPTRSLARCHVLGIAS